MAEYDIGQGLASVGKSFLGAVQHNYAGEGQQLQDIFTLSKQSPEEQVNLIPKAIELGAIPKKMGYEMYGKAVEHARLNKQDKEQIDTLVQKGDEGSLNEAKKISTSMALRDFQRKGSDPVLMAGLLQQQEVQAQKVAEHKRQEEYTVASDVIEKLGRVSRSTDPAIRANGVQAWLDYTHGVLDPEAKAQGRDVNETHDTIQKTMKQLKPVQMEYFLDGISDALRTGDVDPKDLAHQMYNKDNPMESLGHIQDMINRGEKLTAEKHKTSVASTTAGPPDYAGQQVKVLSAQLDDLTKDINEKTARRNMANKANTPQASAKAAQLNKEIEDNQRRKDILEAKISGVQESRAATQGALQAGQGATGPATIENLDAQLGSLNKKLEYYNNLPNPPADTAVKVNGIEKQITTLQSQRVKLAEQAGIEKPMSPGDAGRFGLIVQGRDSVKRAYGMLVKPDGKVNRANLTATSAGFYGTIGRQIDALLTNSIWAQVRPETGAAMSPGEAQGLRDRYYPSLKDNDATIKQKLSMLHGVLASEAKLIDPKGEREKLIRATKGIGEGSERPVPGVEKPKTSFNQRYGQIKTEHPDWNDNRIFGTMKVEGYKS